MLLGGPFGPLTKGFRLGFPMGRDIATFRDNGTEVTPYYFIVLGQMDNRTSLKSRKGTGQDGAGQPKFGMGRAGTAKIQDRTPNKTGQSRKGHSKTRK